MASSTQRIASLDILHPSFREKLQAVLTELQTKAIPFEVFESYRTPERQAFLFAQGRTRPGAVVTKADAWFSYHQYGLAVDMVLKLNGNWSWDTSGANAAHWKTLHAVAATHGLEPLSWELPHLQLMGHSGSSLQAGNYPAFGDDTWAENLAAAIAGWSGTGAPPPPAVPERPAVSPDTSPVPVPVPDPNILPVSDGLLDRPAVPAEVRTMSSNSIFEAIQLMIDKWEGGYVDNPADPGGATNMGITRATLAQWRGTTVTKDDVKNLTRAEQRQIMKANYYNVISGDDLPPGAAAVTYNAAILHGTTRAAKFLQTVIARTQPTIKVDGAIGPLTVGAAKLVNGTTLVKDFIALELAFLQGLAHWPTFGKGWTNRLNDILAFAIRLEADATAPLSAIPDVMVPPTPDPTPTTGALGVDNMLGETIGNFLIGKKTTIGGIGTLFAYLAPTLGPLLGLDTTQMAVIQDTVLPLALTMLGWGGLGKIDRWIGTLET